MQPQITGQVLLDLSAGRPIGTQDLTIAIADITAVLEMFDKAKPFFYLAAAELRRSLDSLQAMLQARDLPIIKRCCSCASRCRASTPTTAAAVCDDPQE